MSTEVPPSRPAAAWAALQRRFGRWLPLVGFVGGFAWDVATLRRIDQHADNFTLLAYLLALAGVLATEEQLAGGRWPRLAAHADKLRFLGQFLQGGLYSAYVIFYGRSASGWESWLFLLPLVALMLAHELAEGWLDVKRLGLALFTFSSFSLFSFFLPVVLAAGAWLTFLGAVGLTLVLSLAIAVLGNLGIDGGRRRAARRVAEAAGVLGLLISLELTGITPPVPLSVVDVGVFHELERDGGTWTARYRDPGWRHPLRRDDRPFLLAEGDTVRCVSAVFAPRGLRVGIQHRWQKREPDGWRDRDVIAMQMAGGRERGWRGWTEKRRVDPGRWRVRIERDDGRVLGQLTFDLKPDPAAGDARRWKVRVIE